ncbi:MAG: phosphatase PAP2 family protein [Candidatus Dormibacteria bacterium]
MGWNRRWYLDLNRISRHTGWAHPMAAAYAVYAGLAVLAVLLVLGAFRARRSPAHLAAALGAGAATIVAFLINQPISSFVAEPRPYASLPGVLVLIPRSHDFALPSDHAVVAGAVIMGIFLYDRWLALPALLAGLALALDRVYVGAHYPWDVISGLLLGAAVAALLVPPLRRLLTPPLARLARGAGRRWLGSAPVTSG